MKELVESFSFQKTMRWDDQDYSFGRPIRWFVVLLGDQLIECSVFGVKSSRTSRGNWVLNDGPIELKDPESYVATLESRGLYPDHETRKGIILRGIEEVEKTHNCKVVRDNEMVSVLADSLDSPRVSFGSFDRRFLELPESVLITCMWHHQYFLATREKYFSKPTGGYSPKGDSSDLLPHFVALIANPEADEEVVRRGNEEVLVARLEDAAFFFEEDKRTPLGDLLPKLEGMALHRKLGDLCMKSKRLGKLTPQVAGMIEKDGPDAGPFASDEFQRACATAGLLSKADLVTHMVGEFPELQGIMGGIYASHFGEPKEVGDAIADHYKPRSAVDDPPGTDCGRALAISDKLDSICAFFGAGLIPSGSQDPLGLRREAQGIVSIVLGAEYRLPLREAIDAALLIQKQDGLPQTDDELRESILAFIKQRLSFRLIEADGIRQDLVASVVSHPCDDLMDLRARAIALQEFSQDEQFGALTTGLKRASNILKGQRTEELDPSLLCETEEKQLWEEIANLEPDVRAHVEAGKYLEAFRMIAGLRPSIDRFFDEVMVMCEDDALCQNRLSLLARLTAMFANIADFSRVVIDKKQ